MLNRLKTIVILVISLCFLTACGIQEIWGDNSSADHTNVTITSISDLQDTDNFRNGALEHIFEGELNSRGNAVGFHYDGLPTKKGEVIPGTETKPNEDGVYEAKIKVNGTTKKSNGGKSTLFPKDWNSQQVVDAINEAYDAKTFISGNTYEGLTADGMVIRMYLDQNEKIISAFPVY
ncbi:EndoU domain-containing protein [Lentibacillus sp. L22]|uniref:EndoU domain-containing protein n=1 Tax=Lentibacillus TaxID=175304 RepID=UPI0022B0933A|nr:EndoU domain-containing protein [Lentibacillus daqui]